MTVKFVLNDGSDLHSSMPIYNVKVANKDSTNKLSSTALSIVDNAASLNYNALKSTNDVITISSSYNSITTFNINVYTKMETSISLENKTYDATSQSKVVEAILKDNNGNTIANMPVIFHFDDKNYTVFTNERGIATINVSSAKVGIFEVVAEFDGDEDYVASNNDSTVNVVKVMTQITSPNKSFVVTSTSKVITAVLKDVYDNPLENKTVSISVNGKIYNRTTDCDGKISLKLSLTSAKTYKLNASFAGDENYTATSAVSTIKVTKQKTKLVVAKKTYKKSVKNKKLVATLKTSAGKAIAKKKVTFKVNGKTYKGTTNSKGKVTVKVKLTAKKTYKVTVKFAGDSKYLSVTKKSTVKIK